MKSENRTEEHPQIYLIIDSLRNLWWKLRIVDEDEAKMENDEEEFMDLWLVLWSKMGEIQNKNHEERRLIEIFNNACKAERNFQKAVDMADGFPPPKSEEDFKFLAKWLFC